RSAIVGAGSELRDFKRQHEGTRHALAAVVTKIQEHAAGAGLAAKGGQEMEKEWLAIAQKLRDEKEELAKRERELMGKIQVIDAPADLEKKVERMTAAITKP